MSGSINISSVLKKAKHYEVSGIDTSVTKKKGFVRNFRLKNHLTQYELSCLLGVSQKAIEKWEQGINNIGGSSCVLLSLFNEHPEVMDYVLKIETPNGDPLDSFSLKEKNNKTIKNFTKKHRKNIDTTEEK